MKQYNFLSCEIVPWTAHEGNDGGFLIRWSCENVGFGEVAFFNKDGQLFCDSECMSDEFVSQLLAYVLKSSTVI